MMKIWLDDCRPCPNGFIHCKTVEECINLLKTNEVCFISFDHDLGTDLTGYDLAKWIEEQAFNKTLNKLDWKIHSANPTGAENIARAMTSAERFWK